TARLVVGPFERADFAGVSPFVEQRGLVLFFVAKQRVHFRLWTIRGTNGAALLLHLPRVAFELLFRPRRRHLRARRHKVLPFQRRRIQQRRRIRLPRLHTIRRRQIRDVGRVVL